MSRSPFDWINSICQDQKNGILEGDLDPKEYNSFIVNRGLSLYPDTVFFAQEMNLRGDIPAESQYHFLHGLVPKKRRFSKWPKLTLSKLDKEFFDVLQDKYKYSLEKCIEISRLLSDDQKKSLIDLYTLPEKKSKTKDGTERTGRPDH